MMKEEFSWVETHYQKLRNTTSKYKYMYLEDLIEMEKMSVRSVNVCKIAGLMSLNQILEFYSKYKSFKSIRNCGVKADNELIMLCKRFSANEEIISDSMIKMEYISKKIKALTPFNRLKLNKYFETVLLKHILKSQLSNDDNQEIVRILKNFQIKNSDPKSYENSKNKKIKSDEDFELIAKDIISFLSPLKRDQLLLEFTKIVLKTNLKMLPDNFEFEQIYNQKNHIKLFTLLNLVINSCQIFNEIQNKIFDFSFRTLQDIKSLTSIAKEINLTRERARQIKVKLESDITSYFPFISTLIIEDLIQYNVDDRNSMIIIDNTFVKRINELEGVNFNVKFYVQILSVFLQDSHSILDVIYLLIDKRKKQINRCNQKCYLIRKQILKFFDFESFFADIYLKVNGKIMETYSLHFKGYLYGFLIEKEILNEVYYVCEKIIFEEFDLIVDSKGYIHFERTTKKQIHEYCSEILEESSKPMTIDQIFDSILIKNPEINTKIESLRSCLNRYKSLFIYFGRSSTYGLRKWEKEKENLKGGTIRDIVEDLLLSKQTPLHINEILTYVVQFRPDTNKQSILGNLKLEQNKKFQFFKNSYIGLINRIYDQEEYKILEAPYNWEDKFEDLKRFREINPFKWPSISTSDKNEISLYRFCYRARKAFKNGKLKEENELLLKSIGFPLEDRNIKSENWDNELNKLITFLTEKNKWPSVHSYNKDERALYRFCYFNRKKYQMKLLSKDQIEKLRQINFTFNELK